MGDAINKYQQDGALGVHTEVVIVPGRENKCSCYVIFIKYVDLFLNHSGTTLISAEECI